MTDRLTPAQHAVIEAVCTPREIECVRLANLGHGTRAIAKRLRITPSTARDYLNRASTKTRAALEGVDHAG